jgi:hypothetical protein
MRDSISIVSVDKNNPPKRPLFDKAQPVSEKELYEAFVKFVLSDEAGIKSEFYTWEELDQAGEYQKALRGIVVYIAKHLTTYAEKHVEKAGALLENRKFGAPWSKAYREWDGMDFMNGYDNGRFVFRVIWPVEFDPARDMVRNEFYELCPVSRDFFVKIPVTFEMFKDAAKPPKEPMETFAQIFSTTLADIERERKRKELHNG